MSLVDQTFGPLAGPLIRQWGMDAVLVKGGAPGAYDPLTGRVARTETRISVKAVLLQAQPEEYEGLYQQGDQLLYPDPEPIRPDHVETDDWFEWADTTGGTIRAKVISVKAYRGDSPVMDAVLVRPQ